VPRTGEVGQIGGLGRLLASRGASLAGARQVRHLEEELGRFADRVASSKSELEQVKLYPPYPIDEPRRAQAIREFNGIAAEVERMGPPAGGRSIQLGPTASTGEAEQAIEVLTAVAAKIEGRRAELAASVAATGEESAAAEAVALGTALNDSGSARIGRPDGNLQEIL
jgi:hypothetical protein